MAISQNFPSTRPSLNLNFARSKKLDPRITFTRTSSATYTDENGLIKIVPANEARFDHDSYTGESLGLLVEEQRQNLLLNSEDFSTSWSIAADSYASISTNQDTSPNGTITADKLVEDTTSNSVHRIQQGISNLAVGTYTYSVYLKPAGRNFAQLILFNPTDGNYKNVKFNIQNGTVDTLIGGGGSQGVIPATNGWYRCWVTATSTTIANTQIYIYIGNLSGSSQTYTGDGTSGIYVWGAQLEAGAFPTSYIPTTTAAATRSADVASITGIDTASWYNHLEGTICTAVSYLGGNVASNGSGYSNGVLKFAEAEVSNLSRVIRLATQNTPDSHSLVQRNSTSSYLANENTIGDLQVGQVYRYSGSYVDNSTSGLAFVVDGGTVRTNSTAAAIPQATRLLIGRGNSGTVTGSPDTDNQYCNGTIRRITYWPTRLPNSTLQTLTK